MNNNMADDNNQSGSSDFITETKLVGVFIISRPVFDDPRGFFREAFRRKDLEERIGFSFELAQVNHSRSGKGTLRGIHIAPWHKLVMVTNGAVQEVVVDARPDSPTFGQHVSMELGGASQASVFIPAGCGNAFLVTSEQADYSYLTTDYWAPGREKSVIYNDLDLGISWDTASPLLSEKDLQAAPLREIFPDKFS